MRTSAGRWPASPRLDLYLSHRSVADDVGDQAADPVLCQISPRHLAFTVRGRPARSCASPPGGCLFLCYYRMGQSLTAAPRMRSLQSVPSSELLPKSSAPS
jgi:hypothetical protein